MPQTLTTSAVERSTYAIPITFRDDAGAAVTPTAATWSLRTRGGFVVNSREDVAITPLASSATIVLRGADLAVADPADCTRVVTVEWTYDSDLGAGLPGVEELAFTIAPVVGVG